MKIDLYTKNTKKKFIFSNSLVTDCLEHHNKQMQEMLRRVYSTQLSHKQLPSLLPLLRWGPIPKKGGGLPIYLFSLAHRSREIPFFFEELISRWLIPGMRLPILSAQNHTFSLPQHKGYRFFFATLLVKLETKDQVDAARKNLFPLAKEICQGMGSSGQIRSILEMKRLSIPGKSNCIYENLYAWMQRFPKRFKKELLHEAQHFLLDCGEKFLSIRDVRHISRIISFHYLFRRHMEKKIRTTPEGRHLFLKIRPTFLHYPFGLKKVMAIVIAMNALKEYERFSLPHIISAIQKFIPSARAIKNSFYSHKVHHETTQTLYLEIEKTRGEEFFLKEFSLLQKELGPKLKQSIELLAPSLFIPRNEEELYRNIISLSRELKYVRDLPQAMISFLEQKGNHLKFNVILLRLLSLKTIPLVDKAKVLPPHIRFTHEKVTTVGTLRKKYPKQANVFSLEIETHLFLRGNYSVDLVKARQFVAKVVEMLVGPYRDYNGGLLHKQNQQLEILKEQLDDHDRRHELFVENLFYSLTPSILQTTLSVDHACVLFSLLLSTLEEELPAHTDYLIKKEIYKGDLCLVIKCNQEEIKTLVTDVLHQKTRTGLGWTSIESDGHFYLGVIMNAKGSASKVLKSIHGALTRWKRKQKNLQILKLHLSRAPLSLDPRIGTDRNSAIIIKMLYDGLMRIGLDGTPELSIAKSVEISSDKKTYRFTLKESYWSNGALLSAFDFEYAWKKILDPKFPSVYSFLFSTIKNATAVKQGELP
ncbi:MAG: hypothetical protein KDK55_06855, partial [Chlamydiia bacterium]|nr:hypothetical protein [Chlamydiia bacterium]